MACNKPILLGIPDPASLEEVRTSGPTKTRGTRI